MGCVYLVENRCNGKVYIGQTRCSLKKRMLEHNACARNKPRGYFHKAIRRCGQSNFIWTNLVVVNDEWLDVMEWMAITLYRAREPRFGYNLASGGRTPRMHDATRMKISRALMGHPVSASTKEKLKYTWFSSGNAPWNKGYKGYSVKLSPIVRVRKSQLLLARHHSDVAFKKAQKAGTKRVNSKRWRLVSPTGELIFTDRLVECSVGLNLNHRVLRSIAGKVRRSYKGWKCERVI